MVKKIITNTIMFVAIVGFVIGFGKVFGPANNLVGVTVMISMLVLMKEDLTKKPFENFMKLISINVILGLFSHIASGNMWLGLILNFLTLATIGYFLSFNLNKSIIVPFGLKYLFMLYTPVSGPDYMMRMLGLIVGAALVMLVQFIIHSKTKDSKKIEFKESELIEFEKEEDPYKEIVIFGKIFKYHPIRAAYAIRIGLLTALTAFISDLFNLNQGRWIVYTVFAITELYSEHCKIRSKQRFQGTVIGALIILTLFIFIKDNMFRSLIVLAAGYADTYTNNYRDQMVCVTVSVMASTSIANGTIITALERIGFVFLGVILALAANNLIFNKEVGIEN